VVVAAAVVAVVAAVVEVAGRVFHCHHL